ncbi:MAG: HDOD domain-containing protein [Mariniblastus sp.]
METKTRTKRFSWLSKNRVSEREIQAKLDSKNEEVAADLPTAEAYTPPRELAEALIQTARNIQMLPDIAIQAIALTESQVSTVQQVVDLVAQDVQLTTDVLSLSNSALFAGTGPTLNLEQAILRVGRRQIKNMIMAASVTAMMQSIDWKEVRTRDILCEHGLMTAVINTRLSTLFKLGMQGEEFTAGLVHDIGRTLLAVALPDQFSEFDPLNFDESDELLSVENKFIRTNHAVIGAWFLQRNALPEELVTVARYHHSVPECTKFKRLVALTAVADELANTYQREGADSPKFAYETFAACENLEILEQLGVENAAERLREFAQVLITSSTDEVKSMMKR